MKGPGKARRVALFIDVENLVHERVEQRDWDGAEDVLARVVAEAGARGTLVARVASCGRGLAGRLALPLAGLGVRTFAHRGGADAADLMLIERLRAEIPASCDVVVIASGDHIFASEARRLRSRGRRVEVIAPAGHLSRVLRANADAASELRMPARRPEREAGAAALARCAPRLRRTAHGALLALLFAGLGACIPTLAEQLPAPAPDAALGPSRAVGVCLDASLSYPARLRKRAERFLAAEIERYPGTATGGLTLFVRLIRANSFGSNVHLRTVTVPAVPSEPAYPQELLERYPLKKRTILDRHRLALEGYASALAEAQKSADATAAWLRKLRVPHRYGTDVAGCLTVAGRLLRAEDAQRRLIVVSDLKAVHEQQGRPNLRGVRVDVLFMPCATYRECTAKERAWKSRLRKAGATDIRFWRREELQKFSLKEER